MELIYAAFFSLFVIAATITGASLLPRGKIRTSGAPPPCTIASKNPNKSISDADDRHNGGPH
jgi:hypothetical protein